MGDSQQRIKIAVQKSGRLTEHSLDLLERCGVKFRQSKDQLFCFGENMPVDLLLVRDDDIPGLVADDVCDLGIVGLNTVEEKRQLSRAEGLADPFKQVFALDFGHCRLAIAAPEGTEYAGVQSLKNKKIATSYEGILRNYLNKCRVDAEIVHLSGAVEIAPKLGRAEFICDLVSTGSTLAANGLVELEVLLESEAVVIQRPFSEERRKSDLDPLSANLAAFSITRGMSIVFLTGFPPLEKVSNWFVSLTVICSAFSACSSASAAFSLSSCLSLAREIYPNTP